MSSRRVNGTSRGFHDDTAAMGVLRGFEGVTTVSCEKLSERGRVRPPCLRARVVERVSKCCFGGLVM
jgi:hypothetical protein